MKITITHDDGSEFKTIEQEIDAETFDIIEKILYETRTHPFRTGMHAIQYIYMKEQRATYRPSTTDTNDRRRGRR